MHKSLLSQELEDSRGANYTPELLPAPLPCSPAFTDLGL